MVSQAREGPSRLAYRAFLSAVLAFDQPDNDQQNHRADEGIDHVGNKAATDEESDPRQQPAGDKRADNADDDVADQPETAALDHHPGKPAGDRADNQPNDDIHASP